MKSGIELAKLLGKLAAPKECFPHLPAPEGWPRSPAERVDPCFPPRDLLKGVGQGRPATKKRRRD